MDEFEPRGFLEQLHGEMRGAAVADRAVIQLARLRFRERHELLDRIDAEPGIDDQQVGAGPDEAHRRQILERVVFHFPVEHGVDRERAGNRNADRVAVGSGPGDERGAEVAARAGTVLDDHRLAERRRELLREHARDQVGRAAGGKGHDQVDRARRPVLRIGRRRLRRGARCESEGDGK